MIAVITSSARKFSDWTQENEINLRKTGKRESYIRVKRIEDIKDCKLTGVIVLDTEMPNVKELLSECRRRCVSVNRPTSNKESIQ